jgi:hypothetical protein
MANPALALPLFAYGTLRDPDILRAVLGRPPLPHALHMARAPGFHVVHYPGRAYPALVRAPGAAAEGVAITDLSPFERDLLDAYEGAEYRRQPIAVLIEEDLFEADAYLPTIPVPADNTAWSLIRWQTNHKADVIVVEAEAASALRARLIAMRPN